MHKTDDYNLICARFKLVNVFIVLGIILLTCTIITLSVGIASIVKESVSATVPPESGTMTSVSAVTPHFMGSLRVDAHQKIITLSGGKNRAELKINCGIGIHSNVAVTSVDANSVSYTWPDQSIKLQISVISTSALNQYQISWTTSDVDRDYLEDHISFGSGHWYGGAEMFTQKWPMDTSQHDMAPYMTNDIFKHSYGNVQERYWLSSDYFAITVEDTVPLWVALNNPYGVLALHGQYTDSQYINFIKPTRAFPLLKYSIWTPTDSSTSLTKFHLTLLNKMFDLPSGVPDLRMISHPIWSTWARYKKPINQSTVLAYASEIKENGFNNSQIEIDDEWATHYGDMKMDPNKFPDPRAMTNQLKSMGFRSTIWVHPFANSDSVTALLPANLPHWVQQRDTNLSNVNPADPPVPAFGSWWDGYGVILDPTNPRSATWFVNRLKTFLDETGIDSYKFDAGETNWLPNSYRLHTARTPNDYSRSYAKMCSQLGNMIEVRVGCSTQKLPIFLRILDRDSRWTEDNGLASVIPATLLFGFLGYPFILPDMVGGNAYNGSDINAKVYPDRELYIRWVQLNALLPSIQFSITPWDYQQVAGDGLPNVTSISQSCMQIRSEYSNSMQDLAVESTKTGAPIIRPMWWSGDESELSLTASDQFMLGDDILVAPIIHPNQTSRMVYFPPGKWIMQQNDQTFTGDNSKQLVQASIYTLPYFIKEN